MPYNRISFEGTINGGESFSTGIAFSDGSGSGFYSSYADLLIWAQNIRDLNDGTVFPTSWRALLSGQAAITRIKVEFIGADGKADQIAEALVSAGAGSVTAFQTPQVAVVVSLRTGRPGRSYRGRMYLPAMGGSVNPDSWNLNSPNSVAVAADAAIFLGLVQDAQPGDLQLRPVVWSEKLQTASAVTQISVGNKFDIQRRRRDSLAEVYSTVDYAG